MFDYAHMSQILTKQKPVYQGKYESLDEITLEIEGLDDIDDLLQQFTIEEDDYKLYETRGKLDDIDSYSGDGDLSDEESYEITGAGIVSISEEDTREPISVDIDDGIVYGAGVVDAESSDEDLEDGIVDVDSGVDGDYEDNIDSQLYNDYSQELEDIKGILGLTT